MEFVIEVEVSSFCFIIDQYSLNFNNDKKYEFDELDKIINLVNESKKIKLIICPTINNVFSKNQITYLFTKALDNKYKRVKIYYI